MNKSILIFVTLLFSIFGFSQDSIKLYNPFTISKQVFPTKIAFGCGDSFPEWVSLNSIKSILNLVFKEECPDAEFNTKIDEKELKIKVTIFSPKWNIGFLYIDNVGEGMFLQDKDNSYEIFLRNPDKFYFHEMKDLVLPQMHYLEEKDRKEYFNQQLFKYRKRIQIECIQKNAKISSDIKKMALSTSIFL